MEMEMVQAMKIGGHPTISNLKDCLISRQGDALVMEMAQAMKIGGYPNTFNLHNWLIT
jgi:hypothetical protein